MQLFTMTQGFRRAQIIDGYSSAIWTERFFSSGDIEILCPLDKKFVDLLSPGTLVGHGASREVAMVQNHEVEDGLLKVTGPMLDEALLNNRMAWFKNPDGTDPPTSEFKQTSLPGEMIAVVVTDTVINPVAWTGGYASANLDWARDKIENLTLGFVSDGELERPRTFPIGPLYDGLRSFASAHGMGFRIFLESADDSDYSLVFTSWLGRDLTSQQDDNPLVRLSPNLNSLMDTKEVLSISEYKNVAYVFYDGTVYTYYSEPGMDVDPPEGLDRRVMVRDASGDPPVGELDEYLAQHAYDAFANNNYIRAIDGQASIPSKYKYQRDYGLGDIIELEGITGNLAKARVTEYIRAENETGDHEYPTVSVVDPLDNGNFPEVDGPDDPWDPDPDDWPDPDDPDPPWPPDPHPRPYPKPKPYPRPKPYPPYDPEIPPDPPPDPPDPYDPDPPPDPDNEDDWPHPDEGTFILESEQRYSFEEIGPYISGSYGWYAGTGPIVGSFNIPFNENYWITWMFTLFIASPWPGYYPADGGAGISMIRGDDSAGCEMGLAGASGPYGWTPELGHKTEVWPEGTDPVSPQFLTGGWNTWGGYTVLNHGQGDWAVRLGGGAGIWGWAEIPEVGDPNAVMVWDEDLGQFVRAIPEYMTWHGSAAVRLYKLV